MVHLVTHLVLFTIFMVSFQCLNILLVLPCYGGHFGAMVSIIKLLSEPSKHNLTVIETSSLCHKKLLPLKEKYSFEVIQEHSFESDFTINGLWGYFLFLGNHTIKGSKLMTEFMTKFLEHNGDKFDILVADLTNDGVLIAAEVFNKPVVASVPGFAPGVEKAHDQYGFSLAEAFFFRIALRNYLTYLDDLRSNLGLPDLVSQGNLVPFEYVCRFPALIYTSPAFYPTPHESMDYLFIGGYRGPTESDQDPLSQELQNWLDQDSRDVVYVSLGTNLKEENGVILEFCEGVRNQKRYRVIWSLSKGMQDAVFNDLGLTSDSDLLLSKFLPQSTLLGHPKVKLFVTHGGLLSTVDVIKRGKPSICVPHIADQFYNCRKIKSWGSSETVASFKFSLINVEILKILENYSQYITNAHKYKDDFSKYEKADALNGFLEKIASRKETTIVKDFPFQMNSDRAIRAWMALEIAMYLTLIGLPCLILWCCYGRRNSKGGNNLPKAKTS